MTAEWMLIETEMQKLWDEWRENPLNSRISKWEDIVAKEQAKKLLEYQRNQVMAYPLGVNYHYFEKMLSQLEAK